MQEEIKNSDIITVRFMIENVSFRKKETNFTVMDGKITNYPYDASTIPSPYDGAIIGEFISVQEGDEFELTGRWIKTDKYGYQFKVELAKLYKPVSLKSLEEFLVQSVKKLSRNVANRIVSAFGTEALNIIKDQPEELKKVKGVGQKTIDKIRDAVISRCEFEDIFLFLIQNKTPHHEAMLIYEALGKGTIDKIKDNPYNLCFIPKISFKVADNLAYRLGFKANAKERVYAGIMEYSRQKTENNGDLFTFKEDILKELATFLTYAGSFNEEATIADQITKEDILSALKELLKSDGYFLEIDKNGNECVYTRFYKEIEDEIVCSLRELIEKPNEPIALKKDADRFIENYEKNQGFTFADGQKEAIYMALANNVSILTGGPGTGKTQTINSIIKCIDNVGDRKIIKLCAPTGKAAKRMTELTGLPSKTIHRLLGLNGFNNKDSEDIEDESEEIDEIFDLLIVDEGSMIDAYVFNELLKAVVLLDAKLLIVGDHNQLPSVGAGLILRDLIDSGVVPTTKLTEIFRQAEESQIVTNSHKLINGYKTKGPNPLTFDESKKDFYFLQESELMKVREKVSLSVNRMIAGQGYKLSDIQILSPMRKGALGTESLNALIQNNFNPRSPRKTEYPITETTCFREGDRVMQTVNNYDLKVFNGEVGKIESICVVEDKVLLSVNFGDKDVDYPEEFIEELELAYAITIHKSQGSEFPVMIMPISPEHKMMLNRNLIYTGWTRAKEKVVCIGSTATLDSAVDRTDNTIRNSQIKEKLISSVAEREVKKGA